MISKNPRMGNFSSWITGYWILSTYIKPDPLVGPEQKTHLFWETKEKGSVGEMKTRDIADRRWSGGPWVWVGNIFMEAIGLEP